MIQSSIMQSYDNYIKNGPEKVEKQGEHYYDLDSHDALGVSEFIERYNEKRMNGSNHSNAWRETLKIIPLTLSQQIFMLNWIKLKDKDNFYSRTSKTNRKTIISSSVL